MMEFKKSNSKILKLKHLEGEAYIEKEFIIDRFLGSGATCNVYLVTYLENNKYKHKGVLKEFYPYTQNSTIDKFLQGYKIQTEFRSNLESGYNLAINTEGIYYDNVTQYILMSCEDGEVYSNLREESLMDTLKTILTLTKAVKVYHDAGYLHLDIKPDNIYILSETRELIKLFDFDSVIKKEDISYSSTISYSSQWASLEVKSNEVFDICEASDLYSIGAILFYKLLNRMPEEEDKDEIAAFEYLSDELREEVPPKILKLIKEAFKNTLSDRLDERYENCSELIGILNKIIEGLNVRTPILSDVRLEPVANAVAREKEMTMLNTRLAQNSFIFIKAMGGVGKTELTKMYIKKYGFRYDRIQFVNFNKSIKKTIVENLSIINFNEGDYSEGNLNSDGENEIFRAKIKCLDDFDGKNLIVIDNFNVDFDSDLMYLLNSKKDTCKFIFTTRNFNEDFSNSYLNLDYFDEEVCLNFYFEILGSAKIHRETSLETVKKIIKIIDRNTLGIKLIAGNCRNQRIKSEVILEKLEESSLSEVSGRSIGKGDKKFFDKLIYEKFCVIFDVTVMTKEEKYIMKNLALLGNLRVEASLFKELCNLYNFDSINSLSLSGWIEFDEKYDMISLHHIISDVVIGELKPDVNSCEYLLKSMLARLNIDEYKNYMSNSENLGKLEINIENIEVGYRHRRNFKAVSEIIIKRVVGKTNLLATILLELVKQDINFTDFIDAENLKDRLLKIQNMYEPNNIKQLDVRLQFIIYHIEFLTQYEFFEIYEDNIKISLEESINNFKESLKLYKNECLRLLKNIKTIAVYYIKLGEVLSNEGTLIMLDVSLQSEELKNYVLDYVEELYFHVLKVIEQYPQENYIEIQNLIISVSEYYSNIFLDNYNDFRSKEFDIKYGINDGVFRINDNELDSFNYENLADGAAFDNNIEDEIVYLNKALSVSDEKEISNIYLKLFEAYIKLHDEFKVLEYIEKFKYEKIITEINNIQKLAYLKGLFYKEKLEFNKAIKEFELSLDICNFEEYKEKYKDEYDIFEKRRDSLIEIAKIYILCSSLNNAKDIYEKLLEDLQKFDDSKYTYRENIVEFNLNLIDIYIEKLDFIKAYNNFKVILSQEERYFYFDDKKERMIEIYSKLMEKLLYNGEESKGMYVLIKCLELENENDQIFRTHLNLALKYINNADKSSYITASIYKIFYDTRFNEELYYDLQITEKEKEKYIQNCRFDIVVEERFKLYDYKTVDKIYLFESAAFDFKLLDKYNDSLRCIETALEKIYTSKLEDINQVISRFLYSSLQLLKCECLESIESDILREDVLKEGIQYLNTLILDNNIFNENDESIKEYYIYELLKFYESIIEVYETKNDIDALIKAILKAIELYKLGENNEYLIKKFYKKLKFIYEKIGDFKNKELYEELYMEFDNNGFEVKE